MALRGSGALTAGDGEGRAGRVMDRPVSRTESGVTGVTSVGADKRAARKAQAGDARRTVRCHQQRHLGKRPACSRLASHARTLA